MGRLDDPVDVGGTPIANRLYRAPLLECAGSGPDAVDRLVDELEPAAAAGVGLVFQGATVVRETGGCVAPNMTRVADRETVLGLRPLTRALHDHGSRIVMQLEHGGLRSMETWHRAYRSDHPELRQLAVSEPPRLLRAAGRLGLLDLDVRVLSTDEVYELAADFGRSAGWAVEAGYDGVHIAGANMGIVQQFCSPYYNRRDDEFGGSFAARMRFFEVLHDEIRERAGDVPLFTKVPAETAAPRIIWQRIGFDEGVDIAAHVAEYGYDAVVPVRCSTFWDASLVRGRYPERAWRAAGLEAGYEAAFGSRLAARLVELGTRLEAWHYPFEPAWNEELCRAVRRRVTVPVCCEGGVRGRAEMDRLLGDACDLVGVGRPFYAEPRLPARLLASPDVSVLCESCNNCVVPQAAGAPGMCRTPSVLRRRGELERSGVYDIPAGDGGYDGEA